MAAAWVAAGSTGLLAHPLRHALTLALLGVVAVGAWRPQPWSFRRLAAWALGVGVALMMASSPVPAITVLACAIVLTGLALDRPSGERRVLLAVAWSITIFAIYRLAVVSIPWLGLAADRVGSVLGALGSLIGPARLSTGATYGGLDYLVLQAALFGFWFARCPAPRAKSAFGFGALILGAHLLYLLALSSFPMWSALLAQSPTPPAPGALGTAHSPKKLEELVLWALPVLGAVIHAVAGAFLARSLARQGTPQGVPAAVREPGGPGRFLRGSLAWVPLVFLALAVPAVAMLNATPLSLRGRKVVVHEKGFLNWLKPKHGDYGRLSVGMYGMMPAFFESYGASLLISPELSEADLARADLLILIYPNKSWNGGQLERIWRFVQDGGSLLVLGEHTAREKDGGCRFNEVLQPTALRVAFDSAMFAIGGWLHSYEVLAHPASLGLADDRNQFGVVIGASVQVRWPARPLLVGRWGWADPGDPANNESKGGSLMGNQRYDAGERLGDILLAAEQRFGKGRVVVFGDTSSFTNGILFGSHPYAAALFAALCQRVGFGAVRSWIALAGFVLLAGGLWERRQARDILAVALPLSLSVSVCTAWSHRAADLLPDGRQRSPNLLAYIDATHLERSSGESWRNNGLGGLELTLMRDGYLVLSLPEFTAERLERAGLLIAAAPGRPFSRSERAALRGFIEGGGIFICTVGWTEAAASREMLEELGFYVGGRGAASGVGPEPAPFGHFKAPYYNAGDYMSYVRFHAAWPVESSDPQARPLAYGPRDPGRPGERDPAVILMRPIGRGKAVVIADSEFATNQNLEHEGGQPFEGMRENADFWRWLLSYLTDQPVWVPPKPVPPAALTNAPAPAPLLQ
jgi:hypothetical protein